jgi:hypothetical protein
MTLSSVSCAGRILEVPLTVHFFLLWSCTDQQVLLKFISSFLLWEIMKVGFLTSHAGPRLGVGQVVYVETFGALQPCQLACQA